MASGHHVGFALGNIQPKLSQMKYLIKQIKYGDVRNKSYWQCKKKLKWRLVDMLDFHVCNIYIYIYIYI